MLNFISARWQTLKTKYKKFIPFICTFIFVFLCPVQSYALDMNDLAVEGLVNTYYLGTTDTNHRARFIFYNGNTTLYDNYTDLTGNNIYQLSNAQLNVTNFRFGTPSVRFDFPFLPELYDYYLFVNYYSKDKLTTFVPNSIGTYDYTNYPNSRRVWFNDFILIPSSDSTQKGFSFLAKIPDTESFSFNVVDLYGSGVIGANVVFEGLVFCFEKGSNDAVSSIITAINNQTDYIVNGDDNTGGIVSQFQSNLNEFNSVISQFDEIENGFISDFTSANDEIKSTLSDYQFTGNLLTCANWVTERYMDFFDNSGDFKQYFIYPLIIGIVLFFIGRGQVILGQAYRKPYESTTVTSSDSSGYKLNKDGSWSPTGYKGSTTTITYRSGGKLRK